YSGSDCQRSTVNRQPSTARQNAARLRSIALHLGDERIQTRKPLFVAQARDEIDLQVFAIQVALEVEHVRLQQELATVHDRSRTETCDGRCVLQRSAGDTRGEHALQRRRAPVQANVRGRKTERPAELAAVNDL